MKNFEWCVYTYKHRKMFDYIARKLIKNPIHLEAILERARWHDVDKLLMYNFMDQDESQKIHVLKKKHHLECEQEKTYIDLLETVIDYECSPYTKPDKPLNAFDFLNKLVAMKYVKEDIASKLFDIMHELGIDHSYMVTEDIEGMEYARSLGDVTEEMILAEILCYVQDNPENELEWVLNKCGYKTGCRIYNI